MDDESVEQLEWIGPTGHVSPTYGALIPGRRYPVHVSQLRAFLGTADCWRRPEKVEKPRKKAEDV